MMTDTNLKALETVRGALANVPVPDGRCMCGVGKPGHDGVARCWMHRQSVDALAALSQIEARLAGLEKELDEQDAAFSKQGGRNSDLVARLAQAEAALRLIADNGATAVVGEIEDMDVWCAQTIGRLKGIARSYFTEEGP